LTALATYTRNDALVLLPAIVLVLFASGTMLMDVIGRPPSNRSSRWVVLFGLTGLAIAALSIFRQHARLAAAGLDQLVAGQNAVTLDGLGFLTNGVTLGATALFFLISYNFLEIRRENRAEYYALALLAQAGMYFMCTGAELIVLFLGMELTSICFYVMVGFTRADRRSNEAAVKYLLLGAVSSGILLYGFSLLYGVAGSTELAAISEAVAALGPKDPVVGLAVVTVSAGLLFKIAAAPFHMWAPDAYDGAPTPVTAFLSVASTVASFAVLLRLLAFTLASARPIWEPVLISAAVLSMSVGTIAALGQDRLKRLFAYSSIAHAGYILLGITAGNNTGLQGVYLYLIVYGLMNLGSFAVLISLSRRGITGENLRDLRGLAANHPIHAALFVVLLLSLAGLPPTAGFLGKYYILLALVETGHYGLAGIASAYVVVSLYFYFRLVREMYTKDAETTEPIATSFGTQIALGATSMLTLLVGIFPEPVLRFGFQLTGVAR
jgi:NADH-quinone oxidoreductase subunit N